MNILTTTDYSIFSRLDNNRDIDWSHVNVIVASMKQKLTPFIIPVTKDYEIIDGQHRYEALKILKLPIYYYIDETYDKYDMIRLNSNNKNWTNNDYLQYWLKEYKNVPNNDYEEYVIFREKYNLLHSNALLLINLYSSAENHNKFKKGTMRFSNKAKSYEVADDLLKISKIADFALTKKAFQYAYLICYNKKNFDNKIFLSKLSLIPNELVNQVSVKKFIDNIEEIYNYKNKNKINLRIQNSKGVTNE